MKKFLENNKIYINILGGVVIPVVAIFVSIIAITISNQNPKPPSNRPLTSNLEQISIRLHDKISTPETNYLSDVIIHNEGGPASLESVNTFSFIEVAPKIETDSSCSYIIPVKEDNLVIRDNGQRTGDLAEIQDLTLNLSQFNYDFIKRKVLMKIISKNHNESLSNEYFALFLGSDSSEQMPIGKLMWDRSYKFWASHVKENVFVDISHSNMQEKIENYIQDKSLCRTIGYPDTDIGLENILNERP